MMLPHCGIFMIRLFTLLCKFNQIKLSDRQWFEREAEKRMPSDYACSVCGAKGCMEPFGHYERYLVTWEGSAQVSHTVIVSRCRCCSCGHTHAILPSCLVPYKSYSLRFILVVLRDYFFHVLPVEQLCQRYGISISTLYRWIGLFRCQKSLWLGALEDAALSASSFLAGLGGAFLREFHQCFRISFLEGLHCTDREPPPGRRARQGGITESGNGMPDTPLLCF